MGENNNILIIILSFIMGYMLPGMMKNMCGGGIVEFSKTNSDSKPNTDSEANLQRLCTRDQFQLCDKDEDCTGKYKKYCIKDDSLTGGHSVGACKCKYNNDYF